MVEYQFDIKGLFPQPIIKVASNLLPHTFRGDRRQSIDATSKMSEIIDTLGQLSAISQKLTKPVTSAQRLRMSENQTIYLLADVNAGHNGQVLGLLKVGTKDLYLFDAMGNSRKMERTPCILDFYIHESRQRAGLGLQLFEMMLAEEEWTPVKCSVDRPSEKLLAFLKKHYGLDRKIPQANNFVLYEGFFQDDNHSKDKPMSRNHTNGMHITNSPNTQLFGAHYVAAETNNVRRSRLSDHNLSAKFAQTAPVGRYGAPRPVCSMAEGLQDVDNEFLKRNVFAYPTKKAIIHSVRTQSQARNPTERVQRDSAELLAYDAEKIVEQMQQQQLEDAVETESAQYEHVAAEDQLELDVQNLPMADVNETETTTRNNIIDIGNGRKPSTFQLSKQHTGMKNRSFGVGMAVTPTQKMEFNQEQREDFGMVKINRALGKLNSPNEADDTADNMLITSAAGGLTDQGYHDLKFFHNRLW